MENNIYEVNYFESESMVIFNNKEYFDYLISLKTSDVNEPVDYTPSFIYL